MEFLFASCFCWCVLLRRVLQLGLLPPRRPQNSDQNEREGGEGGWLRVTPSP